MPDRYMKMRRTAGGLLVPDHVTEEKKQTKPVPERPRTGRYSSRRGERRRAQRAKPAPTEKPKATPGSVLKLNRAMRRKLGKPWKGRKMARDLARRRAAAQLAERSHTDA